MKTKFIYVILAALLIGSQTISAQNKDNKTNKQRPTPEQMIQRQANQMVTTLMLDDATAAKFTPVYEKYLKDLSECRMMNRRERPRNNNAEATPATKPVLTDAEIEKQIKDQLRKVVRYWIFARNIIMNSARFCLPSRLQKSIRQKKAMRINSERNLTEEKVRNMVRENGRLMQDQLQIINNIFH